MTMAHDHEKSVLVGEFSHHNVIWHYPLPSSNPMYLPLSSYGAIDVHMLSNYLASLCDQPRLSIREYYLTFSRLIYVSSPKKNLQDK